MTDYANISSSPAFTSTPKENRKLISNTFGIETLSKKFKKEMATKKLDAGFKKVMDNITFKGYSTKGGEDSEDTTIRNAVKNLYYGSETARKMLDKLGNQPFTHPKLDVINNPDLNAWDQSVKTRYEKKVFIHPSPDGYMMTNDKGLQVVPSVERALAHELSHILNGTEDNHTDKEPMGDTVRHTNKIMEELKSSDKRGQY